jgi:hypothetical protein
VFQTRNREVIRAALTREGYDQLPEHDDEPDDWTDEADGSHRARLKAKRANHMRMRTRVVTALWVEASEEEKAAVAAQVIAENEEMREKESRGEPEAAPEECNPAQLQE